MRTPTPGEVERLAGLVAGRRWLALTGAGMSTDSGIPDYRGPNARQINPITFQEFMGSQAARRRYWARSMMGFRSFGSARPNVGHRSLARVGVPVITQNVDDLHRAAGSETVVDLHGLIGRVVCTECGELTPREELQGRLERANPDVTGWIPAGSAELRPDGDADVADPADFVVPGCRTCGGMLKPDVVFFGESVPLPRVAECRDLVDASDALVVFGSSLAVMSGLRFVRQAAALGRPVAIVTEGVTRGDDLADLKISAGVSETLRLLESALEG